MLPTRLSHSLLQMMRVARRYETHTLIDVCQELLGKGPEHDEQLLGWAVQLLGLVLEPHEAQAMYSQLFAVLARAARTEQLCPSESPYAGPYSDLALAGAYTSSTAPTSASLPPQKARKGFIPGPPHLCLVCSPYQSDEIPTQNYCLQRVWSGFAIILTSSMHVLIQPRCCGPRLHGATCWQTRA